jgi:hypothetical protein
MSDVGRIIEHTSTRLAAATSIATDAVQRSPAGPTAREMQEIHQITWDLETSVTVIQHANERAARDRRITNARAARDRRITDRPMIGPAAATNTGNGGALESRVAQAAARVAQALAHYEQHRSRESYAERDTRLGEMYLTIITEVEGLGWPNPGEAINQTLQDRANQASALILNVFSVRDARNPRWAEAERQTHVARIDAAIVEEVSQIVHWNQPYHFESSPIGRWQQLRRDEAAARNAQDGLLLTAPSSPHSTSPSTRPRRQAAASSANSSQVPAASSSANSRQVQAESSSARGRQVQAAASSANSRQVQAESSSARGRQVPAAASSANSRQVQAASSSAPPRETQPAIFRLNPRHPAQSGAVVVPRLAPSPEGPQRRCRANCTCSRCLWQHHPPPPPPAPGCLNQGHLLPPIEQCTDPRCVCSLGCHNIRCRLCNPNRRPGI